MEEVIGGAGPPSRYRWKSFTEPIFIAPLMEIPPWHMGHWFSIKKPRIVPQPCDGSMAIQVFHHRPNHNSRESLFSTRPMAGIHGHMGHRMDMSGPDRAEATLVSSQA